MSAVRLACVRGADCLPRRGDWLSTEEAARLRAITARVRREQFLAARWLVRELLAQAAGGQPRDWALSAGEAAKPTVIGHPQWHVAIAHSGDRVACAVAREEIGIDLEAPVRRRDVEGLVQLVCTEGERRLFEGLDAAQRDALFHELWTVKESWLKRRGEWVAPARLVRIDARPALDGEARTWRGEGWVLALCGGAEVLWHGEPASPLRHWQVRDL